MTSRSKPKPAAIRTGSTATAPRPAGDAELTRILKAIRRIVRAVDLHSRQIDRAVGLTMPQLVVLTSVERLGEVTVTAVSDAADLSPATVVGILDKLEEKGLLERYRSTVDRRIVHARTTATGRRLLASAPPPLGLSFAATVSKLPANERAALIHALEKVATIALSDTDSMP